MYQKECVRCKTPFKCVTKTAKFCHECRKLIAKMKKPLQFCEPHTLTACTFYIWKNSMKLMLNPNVFRCAAQLIESGYCLYCHTAIAEANDLTFFRAIYHDLFHIVFGKEQLLASTTEKNQLARAIALDLAALIAEEGEFDPKEYRK